MAYKTPQQMKTGRQHAGEPKPAPRSDWSDPAVREAALARWLDLLETYHPTRKDTP